MAKFDFDLSSGIPKLDLSSGAIEALVENAQASVDDFTDLAREVEEKAEARRARDEVARNAAAKNLELASERQRQQAELANTASTTLAEMGEKVERSQEISSNPFLRIIEPIAGMVSEKFSRDRLADSLSNDEQTLKIEFAKDELRAGVLRGKAKTIQAGVDVAAARAALESGDVSDLAEQISVGNAAHKDLERIRQELLVKAPIDKLDELVIAGVFTKRQVERVTNLRSSERLSLQAQRLDKQVGEIRLQKASVEAATDEQLADPGFVAELNVPMQFVRKVVQSRAMIATAWAGQMLGVLAQERTALLDSLNKERLKEIETGEVPHNQLSASQAEEELFIRETRASTSAKAKANAENAAAVAHENHRAIWRQNATQTLLREGIKSAVDGIVTIKGPEGTEFIYRVGELEAQLRMDITAEHESTTEGAIGQSARAVSTVALNEIFIAQGLPVVPGVSNEDQLAFLMKEGDLGVDMELAAQAALLFEKADSMSTPEASMKALNLAAGMVKEMHAKQIERAVAGQPVEIQEATKRMIVRGGRVESKADALLLLTSVVGADVQTSSPAYNSAITHLREISLATPGLFGGGEADSAANLMAEFTQKTMSIAERIAAKSLEQAVQHDMAIPLVSEMAVKVYSEVADNLGDKDMATAIRTGVMFNDGPINELTIAQAIIKHPNPKFTITEYVNELRKIVPEVAAQVTRVDGDLDAQKAVGAMNKLLFNNNITAHMQSLTTGRFERAIGTMSKLNIPGTIGATSQQTGFTLPSAPGTGGVVDRRLRVGTAEQEAFEAGRR